jgi:hypothetical protein
VKKWLRNNTGKKAMQFETTSLLAEAYGKAANSQRNKQLSKDRCVAN